jgi:16S rRNA (uracil1498-N3)-methyltransferase
MSVSKVRLYVDHPLGSGQSVPLTRDQAHYLMGVMRLGTGDLISVFNGRDGEWQASLNARGKRKGDLICQMQSKPLRMPPDLWLLFAPIKKARTDFIVEKATELGAGRIIPVMTDHTNSERIRKDRLQAHAIEAAEQCGGTYVPEVSDLMQLERFLADWPEERQLMFCDEDLINDQSNLSGPEGAPWAVLIGPEGGFSERERTRIRAMPQTLPIGLGPRILRADTAAVAALTLWQSSLGDWT